MPRSPNPSASVGTVGSLISEIQVLVCEERHAALCLFEIVQPSLNMSVDIDDVERILSPSILMTPVIQSPGQKKTVFDEIKNDYAKYKDIILVFSLEFGSPVDMAPVHGKYYGLWLAPAVPDVFSWLLADPEYYAHIRKRKRIKNLPTYDEFLSQHQAIFLNAKDKRFLFQKGNLDHYDARRACMVSPSLRHLFRLLSSLKSANLPEFSIDLNKALLSNLLMESYPKDKEIYRSQDGRGLTGEQMVMEVKQGSEVARKYTSDLLRVSRDLLARQAAKSAS